MDNSIQYTIVTPRKPENAGKHFEVFIRLDFSHHHDFPDQNLVETSTKRRNVD
jgi:hypothetical protein